jgi:hypothetical protein
VKGAIATVELFVVDPDRDTERLSLVIGAPERSASGEGWSCRVALANLHRPESVSGRDSFEALARAVRRASEWIAALQAQGRVLTRDRAGTIPFELS